MWFWPITCTHFEMSITKCNITLHKFIRVQPLTTIEWCWVYLSLNLAVANNRYERKLMTPSLCLSICNVLFWHITSLINQSIWLLLLPMTLARDMFCSQAAWQVALAAWLLKPSRDTERFACSIVSTNNDMGFYSRQIAATLHYLLRNFTNNQSNDRPCIMPTTHI